MITGTHAILYTEDAQRARTFFSDVLGLPFVDAGDGWLIFRMPPAELGVHPAAAPSHELFLMCDDIEATVAELTAKGAEFRTPVSDEGFGRMTTLAIPGGGSIGLYEPHHRVAFDLGD
ncbi:MAG: VOC family protein [Pseudonocardia sp.]